jgi:hypothetical protein
MLRSRRTSRKARPSHPRKTFSFQVDKSKLKAAEQRYGHHLLRSNLTGEESAVLRTRYRSRVISEVRTRFLTMNAGTEWPVGITRGRFEAVLFKYTDEALEVNRADGGH